MRYQDLLNVEKEASKYVGHSSDGGQNGETHRHTAGDNTDKMACKHNVDGLVHNVDGLVHNVDGLVHNVDGLVHNVDC